MALRKMIPYFGPELDELGVIKVGISGDPKFRARQLTSQTGYHHRVVAAWFLGAQARTFEKVIHHALRYHRWNWGREYLGKNTEYFVCHVGSFPTWVPVYARKINSGVPPYLRGIKPMTREEWERRRDKG